MDSSLLHQVSNCEWRLEPEGAMRVPAVVKVATLVPVICIKG